jgi:hypothetical protein
MLWGVNDFRSFLYALPRLRDRLERLLRNESRRKVTDDQFFIYSES